MPAAVWPVVMSNLDVSAKDQKGGKYENAFCKQQSTSASSFILSVEPGCGSKLAMDFKGLILRES